MDNENTNNITNENHNLNDTSQTNEGANPQGGAAVIIAEEETLQITEEARAFAEQQEAAEKQRLSMEEQDKRLLEALDEVLEKRNVPPKNSGKRPKSKSEKITVNIVNKGVGVVSLGLILIFLGVIMIIMLFSSQPDYYLPLKLSPVAAILVGIEILFNQMITRGRFKINIPSIIISALLVVGCCTMGVLLNSSYKEEKIEYSNRMIAAEIYDRTYTELRNSADIEHINVTVDLNPDGTGVTKGIDALSSGDYVVIDVIFGGGYTSPKDFAVDCKKIIDGYRIMKINVTDFHFRNETAFNSFTLDVEGKYVQDYSEAKLAEMVNCVYIEDFSYLEDLNDLDNEVNDEGESRLPNG